MSNDFMMGFSTSNDIVKRIAEICKDDNKDVSFRVDSPLEHPVTLEVTFRSILSKANYKKLAQIMLDNIDEIELKEKAEEYRMNVMKPIHFPKEK